MPFYVGHRPVLPGQNTNDWVHHVTGEAGVYSNWSLTSSTHLLQDVGDPELPDHSAYSRSRLLSQVYNGEHVYKPMELSKYSHAGQDAPYLRHAHWEFHGVESSEAFPRSYAATAAYLEGDTASLSYADPDQVTFNLSDGTNNDDILLDADYADLDALIAAIDGQIVNAEVTVGYNSAGDGVAFTSDATGSDAEVTVTGSEQLGVDGSVNGTDAHGISWGYSVHDERDFTFSRHSNYFFHGVPAADSTLTGTEWKAWDYENLPIYARRHEPYIYKGVGDDHVEDPGESLQTKLDRGEESNEHAFQRTREWHGVPSAQVL